MALPESFILLIALFGVGCKGISQSCYELMATNWPNEMGNGLYILAGLQFEIYCAFDYTNLFVWSLIQSFSINNEMTQSFVYQDSVYATTYQSHENDYSLSQNQMEILKSYMDHEIYWFRFVYFFSFCVFVLCFVCTVATNCANSQFI